MELWTFGEYPLATIVHWLQGIACGALGARGLVSKTPVHVLVAVKLASLFVAYEISEMVKVHDSAHVDIFNFTLCVWIGIVFGLTHYVWERWRAR